MSYDLIVFEAEALPPTKADFDRWYQTTTEWGGGHDYNDPGNTTPSLRDWYMDMLTEFPAMNGPFAVSDIKVDQPEVSDYCIDTKAIYTTFSWSVAGRAVKAVWRYAGKHGLCVYDPQSDGVFSPTPAGKLAPAFREPAHSRVWRALKRLFRGLP